MNRNLFVLFGLLLVFIVGLYSINFIFEQNSETRLVILPEKHNNEALIASPNTSFRIQSATKQRNSFAMYNFFAADANTVLLNRMQSSFTGIKLSMLHMDDNEVKDVAQNTGFEVAFTPDRQQAVFTRYGSNEKEYQIYAYDWKKNKTQELQQDAAYIREFISNDTYIGFDGSGFNKVNIVTGEIQSLFNLEEISSRISKLAGTKSKSEIMPIPETMMMSPSHREMYMIAILHGNQEQLYQFSLEDPDKDEALAPIQLIEQYTLLHDGDFIILGEVNDTHGLYLYDKGSRQYKLLKKGDIGGYDYDPGSSRIAYLQTLDNQKVKNELHVAYVKDDSLHSDTVIYRNIQDFFKMSWLEDNLFVGGSSMEASEIYRFTFRVW